MSVHRKSVPFGTGTKNILLTAGPTREPLDDVRYLSNHSSGEMGLALALVLHLHGFKITVVLGPVPGPILPSLRRRVIRVTTAREMSAAVRKNFHKADVFIATAAVSDWRFDHVHRGKIKKEGKKGMSVRLVRNPDILADAGHEKKAKGRGPLLVGFALETENLERNARKKLMEKNLDLVIGNSPASFGSKKIQPLWLPRDGSARRLPRMSKFDLAYRISSWLTKELRVREERK